MEQNPNASQDKEVIEISGQQAEVSLGADGTINVKPPESLVHDPEALANWKKDVESMDRDKLLPKLYRNRQTADQEIERLRKENDELKKGQGQPAATQERAMISRTQD